MSERIDLDEGPERVVAASREDSFVRGLSQVIGGPRGDHAVPETPDRRGRFWTAARIVLALTCLMLALHWVQKSPCRDGGWTDHKQYTSFCYTDVLALYYAENLNNGAVPYLDHPVEYPVLTGAMMGIIGLPVHALGEKNPLLNQAQAFYDINALALIVMGVASVAMLLSLRRRRPWDVALFALSPVLLVTATVNWDLLAIVLAVAGLWLWARKYPLLAGMLLGLGAAAKLWPAFLLGPIIVLALRQRRGGMALATTAAAAVAWLAVNVPVMLANYTNWYRFIELNTERGIDWGTSWYIGRWMNGEYFGNAFSGLFGDTPLVSDLAQLLFLLGCLGVAVLGFYAKKTPRLGQLAFLVVAIFLLTSKVWSQQFTLWLLPLIVLARPKWGAFLIWQVAELGYFFAFYATLLGASGKNVIPEGTFILASSFRWLAVAGLCVLIVRDILRPERDVVRQTYGGDPDGGALSDPSWVHPYWPPIARTGRSIADLLGLGAKKEAGPAEEQAQPDHDSGENVSGTASESEPVSPR